jgi:outer membrane murein-binding lipoprotein Lpp
MKKIIIAVSIIILLLSGCTTNSASENKSLQSEIQDLKEIIKVLEKENTETGDQLTILNKEVERKDTQISNTDQRIEELENQVTRAMGYSGQFMFDLVGIYESLECPIYSIREEYAKDVAVKLVQKLSVDDKYSDKKVMHIELYKVDPEAKTKYTFMCLMFTPFDHEILKQVIYNSTEPVFPSIRLYSITVNTDESNFVYEIN